MTKNKTHDNALIEKLKNEQEAHAYFLSVVEECKHMGKENAQKHLIIALENLTKAQGGIGNFAEKVGLNAEPLYRVLANTILKVAR